MEQRQPRLAPSTAQALLGYVNYSDGRPDPRWQRQLDDAFQAFPERPWDALLAELRASLDALHASGSAAFRDITQAREVLDVTGRVLTAYRGHHADLLAHLDDAEVFSAYFLARVIETVLQLRSEEPDDPVRAALSALNDFVGHRPIAILETRPQGEPYDHERHRPLPIFLRGAGPAAGRYHGVLTAALDILRETGSAMLNEASFSFEQLEEIAIDLRAYDHGHPVNRRPNYVFGEWDPHQIDQQGRFHRYVLRKVTLDALMDRVENHRDLPSGERLYEGAAVLAGTILMATGVSGWGPAAHDSGTSLATLLPRIARYRDRFYERLLERLSGPHAERLRQERETTRQPFGGARQHLNAFLARHRATQLQQRYLAILFAEMGYPRAAQAEAQRIRAMSVRLLSAMLGHLAAGQVDCDQGRLADAAKRLPDVEDLLRRGIACGAFVDPWNLLGYQGLFPLSAAREDAIRDPRVDELINVVEQTFGLYARLMSESTAAGETALASRLHADMEKLAAWWDKYATFEVSDVRRVHGGEATRSAASVASALAAWRQRGETTADLAFWRDRVGELASPKGFALVVEALLSRGDHRAALGLLASWLGQADTVPLEDGGHSFHSLALRWMLSITRTDGAPLKLAGPAAELAARFFDVLEANADEYWEVPVLQRPAGEKEEDDDGDPFEAAYEGMVYQDSTRGDDGAVSDGAPSDHFDLEEQAEPLQKRLRFLATVARLWQVAARALSGEQLAGWLATARRNRERLLEMLDALHAHSLPEPSGDYDSLVEYDRRRVMKEQLIYAVIGTSLDTSLAVTSLRGARGEDAGPQALAWEGHAMRLERSLFEGDADASREQLAAFLPAFRDEPLLFTPLAEGREGGAPQAILRVRINQAVLRAVLTNLPRLGLLRETYDLLRAARSMEQAQPTPGRGVTEFNHFFQSAYQAVLENVVRSSRDWPEEQNADAVMVEVLERLTAPFLALWIEHSRTLQLSILESVQAETGWQALTGFVQRYGRDLFHARFLTLGNLRGILHRGVGAYLEYLRENADPLKPMRLIEEMNRGEVLAADLARRLELVLQAIVENYEEFKDYNTTTTQSDYGENLHVLLDFLRLKTAYERHAWQFRPLMLAHEVLARHGRATTALRWEQSLTQFTRDLSRQHLEALSRLERKHGMRLGTVADRLGERFVKPLSLDRLCALIEPCMSEARTQPAEEERPAFGRLQEELRTYTASPSGVGLDVPAWLRRLEGEVHRVQGQRDATVLLAEPFFRVPARPVSYDEVQRQMRDWERPALPR